MDTCQWCIMYTDTSECVISVQQMQVSGFTLYNCWHVYTRHVSGVTYILIQVSGVICVQQMQVSGVSYIWIVSVVKYIQIHVSGVTFIQVQVSGVIRVQQM